MPPDPPRGMRSNSRQLAPPLQKSYLHPWGGGVQKIFGDITYLFLNIICPKLQHVLETRNHTLEYPFHSICSSTLGAWPPALIENMGLGGGGGGGGGESTYSSSILCWLNGCSILEDSTLYNEMCCVNDLLAPYEPTVLILFLQACLQIRGMMCLQSCHCREKPASCSSLANL